MNYPAIRHIFECEKLLKIEYPVHETHLVDESHNVRFTHAVYNNVLYITFEGSDSKSDWKDNLMTNPKFYKGHDYHSGFLNQYLFVRDAIELLIKNHRGQVCFAGHSLGGAIALIAGYHHNADNVVTMGSPKVSDEGFANSFYRRVRRYMLIENAFDPITFLPLPFLGYRHVEPTKKIVFMDYRHSPDAYLENFKETFKFFRK